MRNEILVFYMSHRGQVQENTLLADIGEAGIDRLRIQGFIKPVVDGYTLCYELTPEGEARLNEVLEGLTT